MAKLLLVLEAPSLRDLYKTDLEQEGHEVETADTAGQAIARLDSGSPQLVILDPEVPGMGVNGTMVRVFDRAPKVPVVLIVTLAAAVNDPRTMLADALVMLSSDTGELRRTVRTVLKRSGIGSVARVPSPGSGTVQ